VKRRVAVVFGGRSAEHEISVISARSVIDALDPDRYEVLAIGVTKDGRWQLLPAGLPALSAGAAPGALPGVAPHPGAEISLDQEPGSQALVAADGSRTRIDVVFPMMHGPYGEDGSIQGFLEMAGVPYVGAGVLASAVGMDKAVQKVLFAAAGLPGVPYDAVHERDWEEDPEAVEARAAHLGYPLFAKPAALGSSIGIAKVEEASQLRGALEQAFRFGRKAVLERAATGARELEVSVLGNDDPVASVPGEIVPRGHAFYDYEAKYLDEHGAELIIPAEISPQPGCVFCDRDDADVTHGAPIQTPLPADTVSLKGQPSGGEEVSDAGSRGRDLGARGGGPEPDRPRPARPRLPRLYRCFVCEKVGLVVFRISKERPEGVRVGRSRGA